ncbi:MAG: hypothetical protein RJA25_1610 [Bacteroidota bacterium]|jgi:putative sigma-54 modulation protein
MSYTENYKGIKLDVQAVNMIIGETVKTEIRGILDRLSKHVTQINWASFHFEDKSAKSTDAKHVGIRLGIPGPDVFASDNGENFMALLAHVEEKLRRQLEKRHKGE